MKKIFIFIIIIFSGTGIYYYQQNSICRNPLTYEVGNFDNKFGITKDKFTDTLKEAEAIWERGTGKDLFNYQIGGKLRVNLVFDERQEATIEAGQSKKEIEESQSSYDSLLSQYKKLEFSYKNQLAIYNSNLNEFEQRLISYNERVAEINRKGGASPGEYKELQQEQRELEAEKTLLDQNRTILNSMASNLNALGDQVNELAKKLNIEVDIHNEIFGKAREFDQGDYINNRINVYQFDAVSDLRIVLAHELGHALGLDHVENSKSIMYYLMEKQDLNNPAITQEDKNAFIRRCEFHIPKIQELFQWN